MIKPFIEKTEEFWARMFSQVLGSEQFAESMGQGLKSQLLLQRAFQDQMERYLQALNLPTRRDLEGIVRDLAELKEAVYRIEDRLAAMPSAPPPRRPGRRPRSAVEAGEADSGEWVTEPATRGRPAGRGPARLALVRS
jgi:hypothetical protein